MQHHIIGDEGDDDDDDDDDDDHDDDDEQTHAHGVCLVVLLPAVTTTLFALIHTVKGLVISALEVCEVDT